MNLWALWGKTYKTGEGIATRPLLCHMVDVAEVVGAMWDRCLGEGLRQHIAEALGCDDEGARRTVMFWAALHDLGKASPAFQRQYEPARAALEEEGLSFQRHFHSTDEGAWHNFITAYALPAFLEKYCTPLPLARDLAKGLGGHHGSWPPPNLADFLSRDHYGLEDWDSARALLVQSLADLYPPIPLEGRLGERAKRQAFVVLVSGLVSIADWIGSMEDFFRGNAESCDLTAYAQEAAKVAQRALHHLQWDAWQPPETPADLKTLFPFISAPYGVQETVLRLAPELKEPSLVLIETPTGSGKTEAALYLADYWAHTLKQRGLYVAMPTMATSNQMHGRVAAMLEARYGKGRVTPLLVHSQAQWQGDPPSIAIEQERQNEADSTEVMGWFLPRKRSLLAPFGVGTVDQTFLSVLLTRHFFVRLFGLAHKTVIFDEVHAYDTYMSTLFARLLGWLRAQNTSVIILSATLPASTRKALLAAYGAPNTFDAAKVPYPSIAWACGERAGYQPLSTATERTLSLERIPHQPEALIGVLREALRDGGCAAVLCNTVSHAQETYRTLREAQLVPEEDLILFHARFPMAWRDEIEKRVVARFGKCSKPAQRRGIVVATQVIEQSLDLDFDLMITDLAPMDLLIQRAGRLHRHAGRERPRPLAEPRLILLEPENPSGLPEWGDDAFIYEPYILLRTWLALQGRTHITLPAETQALIEAVYGEEEPNVGEPFLLEALTKYRARWEQHKREHSQEAKTKLILPICDEDLFLQRNPNYSEDNPEIHRTMRALTRLGDEGITIVCLHQQGDQLTLEPEGGTIVDLSQPPSPHLTRDLVRHSVQITLKRVVAHLLRQPAPQVWRKHSLLRYCRLAIFAERRCILEGSPYTFYLDRKIGLVVEQNPR